MKIHKLETAIWLTRPRAEVFAFFASPHNLDRLTPPWLNFKILTPAASQITQGTILDYRLRLHGVPIRWQSEISVWEPPYRFVDRQTKGPYALWIHDHRFEDTDSGTTVIDHVEYSVPGGALVNRFLVAPDLTRIFDYRHQVLKELFNTQNSRNVVPTN
jgi:ligand-binding SRPBCC domain-containing protein